MPTGKLLYGGCESYEKSRKTILKAKKNKKKKKKMLCRLSIKNVALISEAEIEFSEGLNVLSGETGSGKSVILDSLNFVLGAKADKSMIRYGEDFCLVSCSFRRYPQEVADALAEYDIEAGDELIIKRKFALNGGGYIKLNGETITASMLKRITVHLVDVHGQSEHFLLLNKAKQLECVDSGADLGDLKQELAAALSEIKECDKALSAGGGSEEERAARLDMLEYRIREITSAEIKEGEEEELKKSREKIMHAEKISAGLGGVLGAVTEDGGAVDMVNSAVQSLKNIAFFDDRYSALSDRLSVMADELSDAGECARDLIDEVADVGELNPDEIEKRLEVYKNFAKKYGSTVEEINKKLEEAEAERDEILSFDERFNAITEKKRAARERAYKICEKLSEKRREYAKGFCERVTEKLRQLAMPKAVFEIGFKPLPELTQKTAFTYDGLDEVEFAFSANAGEPVKPLSKIISGGEMSRFMLALKTQAQSACATYVFDEIDAGISGATAAVVAKNFAEIALTRQIIAISHLPSIAAMSDSSLLISKNEKQDKTYTEVRPLSENEKAEEIVRLIGGNAGDQTALAHAKHLIAQADEFKRSLKKA